jgi:saccharopine dehydrogenase-like NADP-dependent oxidoreductase
MFTVTLFGAGKIGETICALLTASGRYKVRVADADGSRAKAVAARFQGAEGFALKLSDAAATSKILQGCSAVMSALPYHCNVTVAELALQNKIHYLDLTEDVQTTAAVAKLAKGAAVGFMPQCGLAPGFISIAAAHLGRQFDKLDKLKLRVGALPVFPSNRLKYNLTWSTDGLINEYGNLCEVVESGEKRLAFPLEGYERFSLDGCEYEAFNTSGGLGSLADTLNGKVRDLNYKTIRYPGHRDLVAFLMQDLGFNADRETLKSVFERSIPHTGQDKCIIFVEASGQREGRYSQQTYASTVYNAVVNKIHFGAIQITTASGICAPLDLLLTGKLKSNKGFLLCEDITLTDFLDNEFGAYYRDDKALSGISN